MASSISSLPALHEFFPPSLAAWKLVQLIFKTIPVFSLLQWTPLSKLQAMGRTSSAKTSLFNLPGRVAWSVAEAVGPLNLISILYTLPRHLSPLNDNTTTTTTSSGIFGTGLPLPHELIGLLYILHYLNRALITPWFGAPSMSPIHITVALLMAVFQYLNSTSIGGWLCYNAQQASINAALNNTNNLDQSFSFSSSAASLLSLPSLIGLTLFLTGLLGNISAEWTLFSLRRAAAKRKAKSEGRAQVVYDKVYVIPEAKGWFKYVMFPHYSLEWVEWTGYWILGGAWGLGWTWGRSAAFMFLVNELVTMTPRAVEGRGWYEKKFGRRPLAGRRAVVPGLL